jgi:hypothetical protein
MSPKRWRTHSPWRQTEEYGLPSTQLKETGSKWKAATLREQTELDAPIAVHGAALQEIAPPLSPRSTTIP